MFVVFIVFMNVLVPDCMAFSVVCFRLFDFIYTLLNFTCSAKYMWYIVISNESLICIQIMHDYFTLF